ncbi:AMP-binding protein [Actinomadura sp. KC216]|uniref:class I adenylate-forming enzyme family protein n=1 Tax=Actinomadura sp. KC216 TaxID=2530370 RepID=UPI001404D5F5|nr:AMP-binding protein [Actinomadura sp. KC216]
MSRSSHAGGIQPSVAWILGIDQLPGHIRPGKVALLWSDRQRTYGELRDRALRLAAGLRRRGLHHGDRVATYLLSRGETFELYFACAYAGLTLVPANFRLTARELAHVLHDSGARLLLTQDDLAETARTAVADLDGLEVLTLADDDAGPEYDALLDDGPLPPPYEPADPHIVLYTSGTTGMPKGVMLGHHSIIWFAMQQATLYPSWDGSMVNFINAPLYGAAMNEQTIPSFLVGATVAIMPSRGWSPERFARLADRWKATHVVIFPSMMEPLLEADQRRAIGLSTLKVVFTGGENCPASLMRRFRSRWPHASLHVLYGMTESGIITECADDEIERFPESVGRPFGLQAVRVVDDEGNDLPVGDVGEVWTAGGAVCSGFLGAPELTAQVLRDGWLATGDLGRFDEHGHLYIEGRKKDMIISSGQNIYPAEIENVLAQHGELFEWTVIGVPDEERGEAVCAVVVAKERSAVTADDVLEHLVANLASYKKPKHIVFVDGLPRNAAGKVLKDRLRKQIRTAAERAGRVG